MKQCRLNNKKAPLKGLFYIIVLHLQKHRHFVLKTATFGFGVYIFHFLISVKGLFFFFFSQHYTTNHG
jgi:hypothetical protein